MTRFEDVLPGAAGDTRECPPDVVALPHREPSQQEREVPRRPWAAQDKVREEAVRGGGKEAAVAEAEAESSALARATEEAGAADDEALPGEVPDGAVEASVAAVSGDELEELGLLWLANRILHPFGYALTAAGEPIMAMRTDDAMGFEFAPSLEQEGRARFNAFLERRAR